MIKRILQEFGVDKLLDVMVKLEYWVWYECSHWPCAYTWYKCSHHIIMYENFLQHCSEIPSTFEFECSMFTVFWPEWTTFYGYAYLVTHINSLQKSFAKVFRASIMEVLPMQMIVTLISVSELLPYTPVTLVTLWWMTIKSELANKIIKLTLWENGVDHSLCVNVRLLSRACLWWV